MGPVGAGSALLLGALLGYLLRISATVVSTAMAFGSGVLLSAVSFDLIADTMIREVFERAYLLTGLVTVVGFLTAFAISRLGR